MLKSRIPETNTGIQEHLTVKIFDSFARNMRDKGWNNVSSIIAAEITGGSVLELGPGPGYVGLEWLTQCPGSRLTALEISREMITTASRNAITYGLENKVNYIEGNCLQMPFADKSFDAVFSNGSLHEWEDPVKVFSEIYRVLKKDGRFCISDLRRDIPLLTKLMMYGSVRPKEIRYGFLTSLQASYTDKELGKIMKDTPFHDFLIRKELAGLCVTGRK
jgi:ubiquinone/menaquinone biosynthesis C-methylase UbiE